MNKVKKFIIKSMSIEKITPIPTCGNCYYNSSKKGQNDVLCDWGQKYHSRNDWCSFHYFKLRM